MKKLGIFVACWLLAVACLPGVLWAADDKFIDCGERFTVVESKKREGIDALECKKIWCRDLENGKYMGSGTEVNQKGYRDVESEICDPIEHNKCVPCFGERKWCAAETPGYYDPEYGAYIRNGTAPNEYRAILDGTCWKWRPFKHNCPEGERAIVQDGAFVCLKESTGSEAGRSATKARAVRRSSGIILAPMKKLK